MNIFNKYTLRTLTKNRVRTIVTIIGIILSAAMFSAVTTIIASLQGYLQELIISNTGGWHSAVCNISNEELAALRSDENVKTVYSYEHLGYSELKNKDTEDGRYICVGAADEEFFSSMPVYLTEGRLPENENEIILPEDLLASGEVSSKLDVSVSFGLGNRLSADGKKLYQNDKLSEGESLEAGETRTYTVTGFYSRPGFEVYFAPGYLALTMKGASDGDGVYESFITLEKPSKIYDFIKERFNDRTVRYNTDLLRTTGSSNDESFNKVMYSLGAVLIVIIMFASVSLIYNAFSISVSERTKQFGLISSIGATKKQLLRSVFFEAQALSLVGVPVGILFGIGGIGVTLSLLSDSFESIGVVDPTSSVSLSLHISPMSIIVSAAVAVITVMISAFIPAVRAVRVSAIDAIRQTSDIKVKPRTLKTRGYVYKLFGFGGMIAAKNFKRNRKKCRATVFSIFLSVMLFISASNYCVYLDKSAAELVSVKNYDIFYDAENTENGEKAIELLKKTSGIKESVSVITSTIIMDIDESELSSQYREQHKGARAQRIAVQFVDNDYYDAKVKSLGLDSSVYNSGATPPALLQDFIKRFDAVEKRYHTYNAFTGEDVSVKLISIPMSDDSYLDEIKENDGKITEFVFSNPDTGTQTILSASDIPDGYNTKIGKRIYGTFMGAEDYYGVSPMLLYPKSMMDTLGVQPVSQSFFCSVENHDKVYREMSQTMLSAGYGTDGLFDVSEAIEVNRTISRIMKVFIYGFTILITLIAAANVFNTISTNIFLRRREFAMLRSVGMTKKDFRKMMSYECLFYGVKGILFGIPVSLLVTWLIYSDMLQGWELTFMYPAKSVIIAVLGVFVTVFATMLYSMKKVSVDNTVDMLKNENI